MPWGLTGGGAGGREQRDVLGSLLLHRGGWQLVVLLATLVGDKEPDGTALRGQAGPHQATRSSQPQEVVAKRTRGGHRVQGSGRPRRPKRWEAQGRPPPGAWDGPAAAPSTDTPGRGAPQELTNEENARGPVTAGATATVVGTLLWQLQGAPRPARTTVRPRVPECPRVAPRTGSWGPVQSVQVFCLRVQNFPAVPVSRPRLYRNSRLMTPGVTLSAMDETARNSRVEARPPVRLHSEQEVTRAVRPWGRAWCPCGGHRALSLCRVRGPRPAHRVPVRPSDVPPPER